MPVAIEEEVKQPSSCWASDLKTVSVARRSKMSDSTVERLWNGGSITTILSGTMCGK